MRRRKEQYVFKTPGRERKPRRFLLAFAAFAVLVCGVVLLLSFITNHQVRVETVKLTAQNLHPDMENWSILHISDLHGQQLGENQAAVKRAIDSYAYSSVVFTGDMVGSDGDVEPFLDLIALLPKDKPIFYLPGDSDPALLDNAAHGSLSALADWALAIQNAGVIILDEPWEVTRGKGSIWYVPEYLYSLDLDSTGAAYRSILDNLNALGTTLSPDQAAQKRVAEYQLDKLERIREKRKQIGTDDVQIAVSHVPVEAEYLSTMLAWQDKGDAFTLRHASLILAGHYCAGQWRIPQVGPVYVPEKGFFPGDEGVVGLEYLMGIPQYISPGLAASDYYQWQPGRLFNAPTVTMLYLSGRII